MKTEIIRFNARDGYPLHGALHHPSGTPKAAVLISSGTGFKEIYYRRFASWGTERGFLSLTYDCRGIGGSAPEDLASMTMDYTDWGRFDMPAALDALSEQAGDLPILHIAHSVGGHFVGFWDNHAKIKAHTFICVGTGYWGKHKWWYRPAEIWLWYLYGQRKVAKLGYLPRGGGWTGAPLPRGVYNTWRRWCLKPDYFDKELENLLKPNVYKEVTAPVTSYIYTDDPIARVSTNADLMKAYPNVPHDVRVRDPKTDYGLNAVGHNGPFTKTTRAAADEIWDWADNQL